MPDDNGMNTVWKKIHPRQVIWVLLTALIAVLLWIGSGYSSRIESLEGIHKEQNGLLHKIDYKLESIDTSQTEIKDDIDEIQREQKSMKIDLEVLKRRSP